MRERSALGLTLRLIVVSFLLAGCTPALGGPVRPTPTMGIADSLRQAAEEMATNWGARWKKPTSDCVWKIPLGHSRRNWRSRRQTRLPDCG